MDDRDLHVFRIDENGEAMWLGTVADLQAAKELIHPFPARTSFLIYNQRTENRLFITAEPVAEKPM